MRRGDVWWVRLQGAHGSEVAKDRPAIIVSNDSANQYSPRIQVVPLTSNTSKVLAWEALIHSTPKPSKAMADQIKTVDKSRLIRLMSTLTADELRRVEQAIRVQLGLG